MATIIRPTLSENNKYYISKHRYYELKHYCLQYPLWKEAYLDCVNSSIIAVSAFDRLPSSNIPGNPTASRALLKVYYEERIKQIEKTALETDKYLYPYLLKAVTEELSYTYLKTKLDMPFSKDSYYDAYRRFFWLLDRSRK